METERVFLILQDIVSSIQHYTVYCAIRRKQAVFLFQTQPAHTLKYTHLKTYSLAGHRNVAGVSFHGNALTLYICENEVLCILFKFNLALQTVVTRQLYSTLHAIICQTK